MTTSNEYINLLTLNVKKLYPNAILPTRAHKFDAGLDLYALYDTFIPLGETIKVPTGIAVNIPEGYYAQIHDRSSMAAKGLRTGAGVVDHGYQGELTVVIHNLNHLGQDDGYLINAGDRIAQLVTHRIELPEVVEVGSFEASERGSGSFGSSGV